MKILGQYIEELTQRYARQKGKRDPKIVCRIKDIKGSEKYACRYSGGEITLEAESSLGAINGMNLLMAGVASGHWAECIGEWQPKLSLRPLWIGCDHDVAISSTMSISLPQFMCQEKERNNSFEPFCKRVIDLGYNSVLVGKREDLNNIPLKTGNANLAELCEAFQNFGLKVIVKPNLQNVRCPLEPSYGGFMQGCLKESMRGVDYLFFESQCWHSDCLQHPLAREATQADLVRAEVSAIESALPANASLIYFLPAKDLDTAKQQSEWLPSLCDEVSNHTIIAFPAVAGLAHCDHLPDHPLWSTLRKQSAVSATPYMPIVNIGSIKQGEGLWPALTLDLVDRYVNTCKRHSFAGVIGLVNRLPAKESLLDCSLWVASQAMWNQNSPSTTAETWFLANRPDLNYGQCADALSEARDIVVKLSGLRSMQNEGKQNSGDSHDECRVIAESLTARLKWLQMRFERDEKKRTEKKERPSFYDYFAHFIVDMRRIISQAAQACNVSLVNLRKEEETHEGFWTQKERRNMLDSAQRGELGTRMAQIHDESRQY